MPRGGPAAWATDTQTHVHKTVTVVLVRGHSRPMEQLAQFQGDGTDSLPAVPGTPSEKSQGQRGLVGPHTKTQPLTLLLVTELGLAVWNPPPHTPQGPERAGFPRGPFPL